MAKRIVWTGSTLRPQSVAAKAAIAAELKAKVWPLLNEGALKPHIFARFSLQDCAAAHHLLESGNHSGKVVLTLK